MKILLDECVPRPLLQVLADHDILTVQDRGWSGIKNGELLQQAAEEFDVFITSDQNIRYQQNLAGQKISILQSSSNDLRRIRGAADAIRKAVTSIQPGELSVLEIP